MPDYTTDKGMARALAAGAGDAPGQIHVDDWIRAHPDQSDYGMASLLRTVSGSAQTLEGGGTSNYFLDNSNNEGNITELGQQTLTQAKQYDPNAHFEDGVLIFDRSKLPAFAGAGIDEKKYGPLTALSTNNAGDRVIDPRFIIHDENYGDYTYSGNLKEASNDAAGSGIMGQMETYMPTVVGSIMSLASGGLMSPQLMQMLASVSEGGDMSNLLMMIASTVANQYAPGAGTAINLAAGAARRG